MDLATQNLARGAVLNQTITTTTTTTTASSSYRHPADGSDAPRSLRGVPPPGAATTAGSNNSNNAMTMPAATPDLAGDQSWPARVVGEMRDMLLLLIPDRTVVYASPATKAITGYEPTQLERNDLLKYIHSDDQAIFSDEMDDCIANGRPLQCHFRFARADKTPCVLEAYGHPHVEGKPAPAPRCQGIFLVCRPYPTKSSQLLDSFLEHKIENIRLNQRIAQLKEEEEEELSGANPPPAGGIRAIAPPQPAGQESSASSEENESSDSLTAEDNERLTSDQSSGEDLSHIEGIEVMTGLFYGDGERSQGLSTGLRQGRLIQCGMEMVTADQQARNIQETDRRKRLKGEYMCTDCGTSDSPEWRKGPEGPKTLCNACGLRWAKKEKKRQD